MLTITRNKNKIPVYDITVEDNHNFFANGILVHNCTEILLHTRATTYEPNNDRSIKEYGETAVCNLGSINLAKHVVKKGTKYTIDWDKLSKTIQIAVRMLDNVIDINFYPTQEAKLSNKRHRPVGLGSMGWHDLYNYLDINYDSKEAVELSNKVYEFISFHAIAASKDLAKERGKYSTFEGSLWSQDIFPIDTYVKLIKYRDESFNLVREDYETLDWKSLREEVKQHGLRNSNIMAIAPTATISYIVGCSPCTEPVFGNIFAYKTMSGDFTMINEFLIRDLKKRRLWNYNNLNALKNAEGDASIFQDADITHRYKSAFEVDQFNLLDQASARGRWIDQGMSVNLFNVSVSLKYLNDLYMHAWNLGLKTTYYLRNKGASTIEKASVSAKAVEIQRDTIDEDMLGKACSIDNPNCESCQ